MAREMAATSCGECVPGKASRIAGEAAVLTDVFTDDTDASTAEPVTEGLGVLVRLLRSWWSTSGVRGRRPSTVEEEDPTPVALPPNRSCTVVSDPDPTTVTES